MAELEKVTKGLECHHIDKMNRINCADCPYCEEKDDSNFMSCENKLHDDALELLKKQKSMEARCELIPKKNGGYGRDGVEMKWAYYCFTCGKRLDGKKYYCSYCGQAVKWE